MPFKMYASELQMYACTNSPAPADTRLHTLMPPSKEHEGRQAVSYVAGYFPNLHVDECLLVFDNASCGLLWFAFSLLDGLVFETASALL